MHCVSNYPAQPQELNLLSISYLACRFGIPVGFSDHSVGFSASVAAVALGATVIEKHFTLDQNLPGPDHRASLNSTQFTQMVQMIRETEQALGDEKKSPTPSELKTRPLVRKALVAARSIQKGEKLLEDAIAIKRPEQGLSPMKYWRLVGQKAKKNYQANQAFDEKELKK